MFTKDTGENFVPRTGVNILYQGQGSIISTTDRGEYVVPMAGVEYLVPETEVNIL